VAAIGKFLWPGYGENVRVLKWILERVEGRAAADETPIGFVTNAQWFNPGRPANLSASNG